MARHDGFAHRLYTGEISYDFIGKRKLWFTLTGIIVVICLLGIAFRGLNLGIEFRGGADFQAPASVTATTVDTVREAVENLGLPDNDELTVTTIGDGTVRAQTRALSTEEVAQVKEAIAAAVEAPVADVAYSLIGASWGQQITTQALIALVVFLVLVMLLIWGYFRDFKMSVSAIVALLHDLLVTIGVYALVGFSVTPATMIGVLTILGYSLYDTVVVFDKIRENVAGLEKTSFTYSGQANLAVNQVLVRSINTTVIGVLPVAALLYAGAFVLGTGPLKDLGLALFVGMVAGAYSSLFIAAPVLAVMREAEPGMKEHRARLDRRKSRHRGEAASEPSATSTVTLAAAHVEPGQPAPDPTSLGLVSAERVERSGVRVQPSKQSRSQRKK